MNSDVPVIKKVAWHYVTVQVGLMAALIVLPWKLAFMQDFNSALLWGASTYLLYSFGSKLVVLKTHRKGVAFTRRSLFSQAIQEFKASYGFLTQYAWLDRFRFMALLDASSFSYREMALCNIAYCFLRLNDVRSAKEFYQRAETEFPGSGLAAAGILHLEGLHDGPEHS